MVYFSIHLLLISGLQPWANYAKHELDCLMDFFLFDCLSFIFFCKLSESRKFKTQRTLRHLSFLSSFCFSYFKSNISMDILDGVFSLAQLGHMEGSNKK